MRIGYVLLASIAAFMPLACGGLQDGTPPPNLTISREPSPASSSATTPSPTGSSGLIAFVCGIQICVMMPDGTHVQRVTDDAGDHEDPSWSPDATRLAYDVNLGAEETTEIFVVDADGNNPVQLTTNHDEDVQPRWSPDGTEILFSSDRGGSRDIWVMDQDGSNPVRLTDSPAPELDAVWAPSGETIAFGRYGASRSGVYVMGADGSDQSLVLEGGSAPAWSSQDELCVSGGGLFVFDLTTGKGHRITRGRFDTEPAWSPDGERIAFRRGRAGPDSEIYVVNVDSRDSVRLTRDHQHDAQPAWA